MERLTEKFKDGRNILRKGITDIFHVGFGRFSEGEAVDLLAEYEDLDEQGKLLKLPCAVGDIVYRIEQDGSITNLKVFSINLFDDGIQLTCKEMKKYGETCYYSPGFSIGSVVFYTREEAEAALKELEEG